MKQQHTTSLRNGLIAAAALITLAGCATTANISPQYIPPSTYQGYDCEGLQQELTRIDSYIEQAKKQQTTLSSTGVGVGVSAGSWGISPNITFGIGKSSNSQARDAKLSRLLGERDAVVQSARLKKCAFAAGQKIYGEQ